MSTLTRPTQLGDKLDVIEIKWPPRRAHGGPAVHGTPTLHSYYLHKATTASEERFWRRVRIRHEQIRAAGDALPPNPTPTAVKAFMHRWGFIDHGAGTK